MVSRGEQNELSFSSSFDGMLSLFYSILLINPIVPIQKTISSLSDWLPPAIEGRSTVSIERTYFPTLNRDAVPGLCKKWNSSPDWVALDDSWAAYIAAVMSII